MDKDAFLPDEKLLRLEPKIKQPSHSSSSLQLLQMQSSAANLLQDQSLASSGEEIFPGTTSERQKEIITAKVQSLSNQFAIFKQQHSNTGIGGPRFNLNFMFGRGKRQMIGERVIDGNDGSFRRDNSHDTTME